MATAIELAQKTLDRILFVAFAERTDLLPDHFLKGAAEDVSNEFSEPALVQLSRPVSCDRCRQRRRAISGATMAVCSLPMPQPTHWFFPIRWRRIWQPWANGTIGASCR